MVLEENGGDSLTLFKGREMSYLAGGWRLSEPEVCHQGELTPILSNP